MPSPYPFPAVVGLDDLRHALLLTAVSHPMDAGRKGQRGIEW